MSHSLNLKRALAWAKLVHAINSSHHLCFRVLPTGVVMNAVLPISEYAPNAKVLFPLLMLVAGVAPIWKYGNYDIVHRNFIQLLALVLALPSIVFCMTTGVIQGDASIGLLGTVIGYAFGVGSKSSSKKEE